MINRWAKRTFAFGTGETTAAKDLDCDFDFDSAERHILNVDVANDGRDSAIQRADRHNLSMTAYGGCLSGGQAACLLPPYPSTLEQCQVTAVDKAVDKAQKKAPDRKISLLTQAGVGGLEPSPESRQLDAARKKTLYNPALAAST